MTIIGAANTRFPEFLIGGTGFGIDKDNQNNLVPDLDGSECSDDDSIKREKYSTKEDQDVAVFMNIANRLPIQSLLFLLHGHVQSQQQLPSSYVEATRIAKLLEQEKQQQQQSNSSSSGPVDSGSVATTTTTTASPQHKTQRVKKFRFAEIRGGQDVRCIVHLVEDCKDIKELWWSDTEMMDIRRQAIDAVKYFRKHRPDYLQAVENIAREVDVEESMKKLVQDCFARGLEAHIVALLSKTRSETVHAVLDEQRECKLCNDSYELTCESLRGQSVAYSQSNAKFARKMAECDQIEALKAILSKWEPETTTSSIGSV
jgi:hypothetical protein